MNEQLLCAGVVEYLTHGRVSASHVDFKDHGYADCLRKYSPQSDVYGHNFLLSQAYNEDTMPFTNFTFVLLVLVRNFLKRM